MIQGNVATNLDASVVFEIMVNDFNLESIVAVIDTGFSGELALPEALVARLQLVEQGFGRGMLADGSIVELRSYEAHLLWHGQRRRVEVYATETESLIGTQLLYGNRLVIDFEVGGNVHIDPLPAV